MDNIAYTEEAAMLDDSLLALDAMLEDAMLEDAEVAATASVLLWTALVEATETVATPFSTVM